MDVGATLARINYVYIYNFSLLGENGNTLTKRRHQNQITIGSRLPRCEATYTPPLFLITDYL
jgi:hypothetical protein